MNSKVSAFAKGIVIGLLVGAAVLAIVALSSGCAAPIDAPASEARTERLGLVMQPLTVSCHARIYVFETNEWAAWDTTLTGVSFETVVETSAGIARTTGVCSGDCALSATIAGSGLSYAVAMSSDRREVTLTQPYAGLRVGYIDSAKCEVGQ